MQSTVVQVGQVIAPRVPPRAPVAAASAVARVVSARGYERKAEHFPSEIWSLSGVRSAACAVLHILLGGVL